MSDQRSLHLLNATGAARTEQYMGREHLVVPVVALIGDNVIHAVNAPSAEFVPAKVISAQGWDGRPLVLGHPVKNGRQVSAGDPRIMEQHAFGFITGTNVVAGKKLTTEAWMDVARLKELGQQKMLEDARAGKPIEVSVGAFVQTRDAAGIYDGQKWKGEWATMTPDHLAFLPDSVGACSVEMGCGANRAAMRVCGERLELNVEKSIIDPETLRLCRDISQDERDKMSSADFGDPDNETFPIKTQADVDAAKHLIGKAGPGVKARIIAIAKRKGLTIPDAWKDEPKAASKRLLARAKKLLKLLDAGSDNLGDDSEMDGNEKDDPDEKAEEICYQQIADFFDQVEAAVASGKKHVTALLAENGPGDDDEVEEAHLEALVATCVQLYGTTNGIIKLATSELMPEGATSPMAYMEARAAAGARHNAKDQQIIQDTHDKMVELGADCSAMKAAELKAACSCTGANAMTKSERIAALLALKDANFTEEQKKGLELLPEGNLIHLHTLAAKTPADALIQAKYNADAAVAAHGHGLNMADEAKAAKDKAKADAKAKEGKKDGEDDDEEKEDDSEDVKAAKRNRRTLKAAKAANMTVEEYVEQEWLKTAPPSIRAMAAEQKAVKAARKETIVKALEGGPLKKEELMAKSLEELETLASYAGVKIDAPAQPNFSGRGVAVAPHLVGAAGATDVFRNPPNGYDLAIARQKGEQSAAK